MSTTQPVNAPQVAGPLKVALLSLPERTEAVLEFFFSNNGGAHFIACDEADADAAVIDLDTAESRAHWARFHAHTGRPAIALSVTPQAEPHTIWVRKPVTPAAMVEAAGQVLLLPAEAAPVETAPETQAPSNVVAWPLTPAATPAPVELTPPAQAAPAAAPAPAPAPAPTTPDSTTASEPTPAASPARAVEVDDPFALPPSAARLPWWRRWWQAVFGAPAAPVVAFAGPADLGTPSVEAPAAVTPAEAPVPEPAPVDAPPAVALADAPTAIETAAPEAEPAPASPPPANPFPAVEADEAPAIVADSATDVAETEPAAEPADEPPATGLRAVPDDEAADEARWCGGLREDRPVSDFLSDRSLVYRPAQHLIGAVGEAALVGRKWQVPTRFDLDGLSVVVDVRRNLLHVEPGFAAFDALLTAELGRRVKTRTLSHAEAQDWEARRASHGEARALDHSLWCAALLTAAGRWPDDLDPQATLYLKHWPNLTRLPRTPHAMRIAALWATRGASLADTAGTLRIAQRHVIAFGNAARALDLITADGSHIARAQRKGSRNRSALTRLLGWLNC